MLKDYSVKFANGNLSPDNSNPAGPMVYGTTSAQDMPYREGDANGTIFSVYRAPTTGGPKTAWLKRSAATNSVYLLLGKNDLKLDSRFNLKLEFDLPRGELFYRPQPPVNPFTPPPPPAAGMQTVHPWAVSLNVKFGNQNDNPADPIMGVTCQFNETQNADKSIGGVKLNAPGSVQADDPKTYPLFKPLNLDTPLDYTRYQPKRRPSGNYHITPFTLELFFDGREAALAGGSALCVGKLSIETQKDIRAFTSTKLSTGQTWIDAVGATLVTATGEGQIFARFRRFTISVYP